ncbi:MAG: zeta toxin family protein [Sulfurimonas sp.]|nr:zeta toxin family protein [Sulfurimonas sp.]
MYEKNGREKIVSKTLYIIAGANGSGKTTFALTYAHLKNLHFINADEIAKAYDSNDLEKYKIKAGKEFFKQLNYNLKNNDESFIIETTLSGKYLIRVIEEAKQHQFEIVLVYLFLDDATENILRVKNRVLNGGHNIPVEDIKRRYIRSRQLFLHVYKDLVDTYLIFFNGDDSYELVAENEEILDENLYRQFLKGFENE